MKEWKDKKDPLKLAAAKLIKEKILKQTDIDAIIADAEHEADDIEAFCEASPKALPSTTEMLAAVYAA
jgi:TPP-dependent pyruvate/acetoin dehydrogenase alpha subunit